MKTKLTIFSILLLFNCISKAQTWVDVAKANNFYVDKDSLAGFDEPAATRAAISENFTGEELKIKLFADKRRFVNYRYNLWKIATPTSEETLYSAKSSTVPGCTNMDFEGLAPGTVTFSTQLAGWTVTRGAHGTGSDACNLLNCCPQQPAESAVIYAPNGYIDPNIGAGYPIYSVFGPSPISSSSTANGLNPQITQGMKGSTFFRLNSQQTGDLSIEKLTKTFSVTSSNAIIQIAHVLVFNGPHTCCTSGAFQMKIRDVISNSVLACQQHTVFAANPNCQVSPTDFNFYQGPSSVNNYATYTYTNTNFPNTIFNKWSITSTDLSAFIGQTVVIEISVSDCVAGGHYTYSYLDIQCGVSTSSAPILYGNNVPFTATNHTITVAKCTNSNVTICAPIGGGTTNWRQIQPTTSSIVTTGQCITTGNNLAAYSLSLTTFMGCTQKVYTVYVVNAPPLMATTTDTLICKGSTAVLFVHGAPGNILWNTGDTTNYVFVKPTVTTVYKVSSKDIYGCYANSNVQVNVQDCTGLSEQVMAGISVFPNPVRDELSLILPTEIRNVELKIINALGEVFYKQKMDERNNKIDIRDFPPGTYFYLLNNNGEVIHTGKVLVQR